MKLIAITKEKVLRSLQLNDDHSDWTEEAKQAQKDILEIVEEMRKEVHDARLLGLIKAVYAGFLLNPQFTVKVVPLLEADEMLVRESEGLLLLCGLAHMLGTYFMEIVFVTFENNVGSFLQKMKASIAMMKTPQGEA